MPDPRPCFRFLLLYTTAAALGCNGDSLTAPPATGALTVTTATTGPEPDPDGYTVQIDGGASQPIGTAASIQSTGITAGNHTVQLASLAPNCTVVGDNPRTVSVAAGQNTTVSFTVTCPATAGSIQVTTATTGSSLDPDGYALSIDGGAAQPVGINAMLTIGGLAAGSHSVTLSGVAANCHVVGDNPAIVSVTPGAQAAATFSVQCVPVTSGDTWVSQPPALTARMNLQAATVDGTIYAVGGMVNDGTFAGDVNTVEAYSVATNAWDTRAALPSALEPNGVSVIDGRLYVAGGVSGDPVSGISILKTLYVYDPVANGWSRKADLPAEAGCGAQGVIDGLLYVYAPCTDAPAGHQFFRYDPATDTWTSLPPPPTRHEHSGSGVLNGKFYLAGSGSRDSRLHVYNPATNSWASKTAMPMATAYPASAVLNGKLYVAGGSQGTPVSNRLQVYDPVSDSWSLRASMPTARWGAAGVVANGQLFVIGGMLGSGYTTVTVEAYTP